MKISIAAALSLLMVFSLTSCKKRGCTDPTAENYSVDAEKDNGSCTYTDEVLVTIQFTHNVGGTSISANDFDQLNYTTAEGNTYSVTKLQYLISEARFYRANGDSLLIPGYHLVDLEDLNTLSFVLPDTIPTNPFVGIGFNYGFDDVSNASGAYTDLNAASWSSPEMLGGGYHQMKFEGRYINDMTDTIGFQYHNLSRIRQIIGTDTTFVPNYVALKFTKALDFKSNTSIEIKMDLNQWFVNPNTWDLDSLFNTLMPNYDAQVMMRENASTVFSIGAVTE